MQHPFQDKQLIISILFCFSRPLIEATSAIIRGEDTNKKI